MIILPTTNNPYQIFSIKIGNDFLCNFYIKYNSRSFLWTMDIENTSTQSMLISGVPLVAGQDILAPYNFSMGHVFIYSSTDLYQEVTISNLGKDVKIICFSNDEWNSL